MKNSGIRLVQQKEMVEYNELSFLNSKCSNRQDNINRLKKILNVVKEVVYCGGAPIADDVMEQPCRGKRRR